MHDERVGFLCFGLGFFLDDLMMRKSKFRAFAAKDVTLSCTCEAGGPGDVQVEVLGGVDEHIKVPVGLRREKRRKDSHFQCERFL